MKGDRLPPLNHVVLHCSPGKLEIDASGKPIGVKSEAFAGHDDGVSVDWLEFKGTDKQEQLRETCARLRNTRTVKESHRIGIMRIVDIESVKVDPALYVVHDPVEGSRPNPAHSLILNVPTSDDGVLLEMSMLVQIQRFV